jgi:hypothetical protein
MNEMVCCPLNSGDGDAAKFCDVRKRVAAKVHKCAECSEVIMKGVSYEETAAMWHDDNKPQRFRTCMLCVEIRDHFACGRGWIFGEVWEQLTENFFPDMKMGGPCMEGLSPAAKGKLIDERMKWYLAQDEVDDNIWDGWAERRPT